MQYMILAEGEECPVDVTPSADDSQKFVVNLGDDAFDVEVMAFDDGSMSLVLDGEQYLVQPDARGAFVRGRHIEAEILPLRSFYLRRARRAASERDGPHAIHAPMTGRLVRLMVEDGQTVEKGTPLFVIEAMKMENEVYAGKSGRITALTCQINAHVEQNALLCRIE